MKRPFLCLLASICLINAAPSTSSAVTPQYLFKMNLFEDRNGSPGDLLTGQRVHVDDSFFVEITAKDMRDPSGQHCGLAGLGLRIQWDPAVFEEIDNPFNPKDANSPLVTTAFPAYRAGSLDNAIGMIDWLEGTSMLALGAGRVIGCGAPERFSLMKFRAKQTAADSLIKMRVRGGVGFVPMRDYSDEDVRFEPVTVTVLDPAPPLGANLVLGLKLYSDNNGTPGQALTSNMLRSGESFFAEISAQDSRPGPAGIIALPLDVAWDPVLIEEISNPWAPATDCNLVTCAFPHTRSGTRDNAKGAILGLRGGGIPNSGDGSRAIGKGAPERFSLLHFRSRGSAKSTSLNVNLGGSMSFADAARLAAVNSGELGLQIRQREDVNSDDSISPLDALVVINHINSAPAGQLSAAYDVNGDGAVTALDVLIIINYINSVGMSAGEGEGPQLNPDPFLSENVPAGSVTETAKSVACPGGERSGRCYNMQINRPKLGRANYYTKLDASGPNLLLKAPTDGWDISDNVPSGAVLERVYSPGMSTIVTRAAGAGLQNCYRLRNLDGKNWSEPKRRTLAWSMKFSEDYEIQVELATNKGRRVLKYTPASRSSLGFSTTVQIGLGQGTRRGSWLPIQRNLAADLRLAQSKTTITNVNSFTFCGTGSVAEVEMK